jgi:hypothetical protein
MNMRSYPHTQKEAKGHSLRYHAESLPNTSAVFSVTALADPDDIIAAARTAALLAKSSGASLSVTVLDESIISLQPGASVPPNSLESSLSSIRTKLLASRSTSSFPNLALEASISSASFLSSTTISLRVRWVDPHPHKPATTR